MVAFENEYRRQLVSIHSRMRLPHSGNLRIVPFNDLYVEPNVSYRGTSNTVTLDSAFRASRRVVVLGDPGGGKSTLSLRALLDVATSTAQWHESAALPFLVILRDVADDLISGRSTLSSHLYRLCRSPYEVEPPDDAVEYYLFSGRALVIFDGLDELLEIATRERIVEMIHGFTHMYPLVHILITSRRVGYDEAALDPSLFTCLELGRFDEKAVTDYVDRWFTLDESIPTDQKQQLASAFMHDSQLVHDLRENPLMLGLMCSIYSSDNYIPRNRPDVYEKCSTLLFERWDRQRNIVVPLPFNVHVKAATYALALWMLETHQSGVGRARAVSFVRDYLQAKRFEDYDEAEDAARQFIDFCTGRAWVLTDIGSTAREELYGFTHRTFLEYFAAKQLTRLNSSPAALFERLLPRIIEGEWEVVNQIALQILAGSVEDGADDWLELACDWLEEGSNSSTRERSSVLAFVTRSHAFIVPRPAVIRRITQLAFIDLTEKSESSDLRPLILNCSMRRLMLAAGENLRVIADAMTALVKSHFETSPVEAVAVVGTYPLETISMDSAFSSAHQEVWRESTSLMREVGIDRLEHLQWPWAFRYEYAKGRINTSTFVGTSGHRIQDLFIDADPHGIALPSLAAGILSRIAGDPVMVIRDDVVFDPERDGERAREIVYRLITATTPWSISPNGPIYNPHCFASASIMEDRRVADLYAILAVSQADYMHISATAGSRFRMDRVTYWRTATNNLLPPERLTSLPISADVRNFLHQWLGGGVHTVRRDAPARRGRRSHR